MPGQSRRPWQRLPAVQRSDRLLHHAKRHPAGAKGIRINCTGPGVTETPILDQLRTAYGQGFLDDIPKPLGRVSDPAEQATVLLFLNSGAASYITGQIIWVDGGNVGAAVARELEEGARWPT